MLLFWSCITLYDSIYFSSVSCVSKKKVEQKQSVSFEPILAINLRSHRINNYVNIFPSGDYTLRCCVYQGSDVLTRIMPFPQLLHSLFRKGKLLLVIERISKEISKWVKLSIIILQKSFNTVIRPFRKPSNTVSCIKF